MEATKKPPGEARSAAILRSASLVKPSMVSAYMAAVLSLRMGGCPGDGFSNDDEHRRGKRGVLDTIGKRAERREHRALALARAVLHRAGGRAGRKSAGEHLGHQRAQ